MNSYKLIAYPKNVLIGTTNDSLHGSTLPIEIGIIKNKKEVERIMRDVLMNGLQWTDDEGNIHGIPSNEIYEIIAIKQ